ncbi:MAG: hypothetical protein ACE5OZ_18845 [Candidatus Heimdallarchaeota archaeon]
MLTSGEVDDHLTNAQETRRKILKDTKEVQFAFFAINLLIRNQSGIAPDGSNKVEKAILRLQEANIMNSEEWNNESDEVYAHVIVHLAAERLVGTRVPISKPPDVPDFKTRFRRARGQFLRMLKKLQKPSNPNALRPPKVCCTEFLARIRDVIIEEIPTEVLPVLWGEGLRFEGLTSIREIRKRQPLWQSHLDLWLIPDQFPYIRPRSTPPRKQPDHSALITRPVTFCVTDDSRPGPP